LGHGRVKDYILQMRKYKCMSCLSFLIRSMQQTDAGVQASLEMEIKSFGMYCNEGAQTAEEAVGYYRMAIRFLPSAPEGEENICAITQDRIGSVSYENPYFKTENNNGCPPVLSRYPHLQCIQIIACNHYFDARALVMHFMRNAMNCPLCRYGHALAPLDHSVSFPGESWLTAADNEMQRQRRMMSSSSSQNHAFPPSFAELMSRRTRFIQDVTSLLSLQPVTAHIFLYDNPDNTENPVHGLQVPMNLVTASSNSSGGIDNSSSGSLDLSTSSNSNNNNTTSENTQSNSSGSLDLSTNSINNINANNNYNSNSNSNSNNEQQQPFQYYSVFSNSGGDSSPGFLSQLDTTNFLPLNQVSVEYTIDHDSLRYIFTFYHRS